MRINSSPLFWLLCAHSVCYVTEPAMVCFIGLLISLMTSRMQTDRTQEAREFLGPVPGATRVFIRN